MGADRPAADKPTKRRARRERPVARAREFTLRVTGGPDEASELVLRTAEPSPILIGKSHTCGLRLTDEMVSQRHIAVELTGEGVRVTDLESTNGTMVNGVQIGEATLLGGERLQIGDTVISFEAAAETTEQPLPLATSFGRVLGASCAMRRLYPLCKRLAASHVPAVIEGETGTGKEVLAEALHEAGARTAGPFVVFDCTTVPRNLIDAALFGHERGAFTGATESRRGVFEQADGGTLLLDEIGDLELDMQSKLLRALERAEVQRVGSSRWTKVNVRVLAATRRDLDAEVQASRFRDDLFYRLAVARIEMPPLRRRVGDVELLARHFWSRMADEDVAPPATYLERLSRYGWPGNVRELKNTIARQIALGDLAGDAVGMPRAPSEVVEPGGDRLERIVALGLPFPRARRKAIEEFDQLYLTRILEEHDGNIARAADAAGVARRYFRLLRARARDREAV